MEMNQAEKERLADRVVEVLRRDDPRSAIADLRAKVEAGDEGEDGMNSVVLALAIAMAEHLGA